MARQCARPTCSRPAGATLSYQYARKVAVLDGLHEDDDPATHDLCPAHADRLTVPQGWELHDQRLAPAFPGPAGRPPDVLRAAS